jgi:hypothetical protein
MSAPKTRGRGTFPWEYDAFVEAERKAGTLKGRRKGKELKKLNKQKQRARRIQQSRERANQPQTHGQPKMIRPWNQSWRVPTQTKPISVKEYALYLKTPHWQEFRERYYVSQLLQECFVCGNPKFELHHHTYVRLGQEGLHDVVPLCDTHHRDVHKAVKAGVQLTNAHTYVKMRYTNNELDIRESKLDN